MGLFRNSLWGEVEDSMAKSKKILQEIVEVMRASHYSIHTERAYRDWIRRYIKFVTIQV